MLKNAALSLMLLLATSCTTNSNPILTNHAEIHRLTKESDKSLIERIVIVEERTRQVREGLGSLVANDYMTIEQANKEAPALSAADYYMTKAWTAMVERDTETSKQAITLGEKVLDALVERVKKVLAANSI